LRYQLPHRGTFVAQEAVNLGKDESGNDHGRRGRERLRVVGPRGTTSRSPGECAEETARVGDRRSAHFSMSLRMDVKWRARPGRELVMYDSGHQLTDVLGPIWSGPWCSSVGSAPSDLRVSSSAPSGGRGGRAPPCAAGPSGPTRTPRPRSLALA